MGACPLNGFFGSDIIILFVLLFRLGVSSSVYIHFPKHGYDFHCTMFELALIIFFLE